MFFMILALTTALSNLRNDAACLLALVAALAADDGDEADIPASENALYLFRRLMLVRQGKRQGWARFCNELGVDSDGITKPFLGEDLLWLMQPAEAAFAALEPDGSAEEDSEQIAQRELEALWDAWTAKTS